MGNHVYFAKKMSLGVSYWPQGGSKHFTPPLEGSPPPTDKSDITIIWALGQLSDNLYTTLRQVCDNF